MGRLRAHWLALLGGALLLVFSVTSVMGAKPADDPDAAPNRGQQVSDFVHDLVFGDEDEGPVDEDPVEDEELEEGTDNHGQCVREFAQSDDVGGPNENHGGAVSEAARVTCWEDGSEDEDPVDEDPAEAGATSDASDGDEVGAGSGKSAAAHQRNAERKAERASNGRGKPN